MMLTFDNETSRPATGARPPVGSHMHGWGEPSNYKTQCSAAYDPLEPVVLNPLLPFGKFTQALLDGAALVVNLALFALLISSVAAAFGAAIFFALFCRF